MFIGTKIKEIRNLKKLTRQDMADKMDMSVTAYRNIEEEDTDINFSRLLQIADVFDMNLVDLVSFGEKITQINSNVIGDNNTNSNPVIYANLTDKDLIHIIDKSKQEVSFLKEKITLLETTITDLRNTVAVLQKEK
jgi:transcriptional regulator with XRE-family HTH domain